MEPRRIMSKDSNETVTTLTDPRSAMIIGFSAKRLGFLIRERGWNVARFEYELQQACRDAELRPTNTYSWVNGKSHPSSRVLPYIAYVLNVRMDELFERGSLN